MLFELQTLILSRCFCSFFNWHQSTSTIHGICFSDQVVHQNIQSICCNSGLLCHILEPNFGTLFKKSAHFWFNVLVYFWLVFQSRCESPCPPRTSKRGSAAQSSCPAPSRVPPTSRCPGTATPNPSCPTSTFQSRGLTMRPSLYLLHKRDTLELTSALPRARARRRRTSPSFCWKVRMDHRAQTTSFTLCLNTMGEIAGYLGPPTTTMSLITANFKPIYKSILGFNDVFWLQSSISWNPTFSTTA